MCNLYIEFIMPFPDGLEIFEFRHLSKNIFQWDGCLKKLSFPNNINNHNPPKLITLARRAERNHAYFVLSPRAQACQPRSVSCDFLDIFESYDLLHGEVRGGLITSVINGVQSISCSCLNSSARNAKHV